MKKTILIVMDGVGLAPDYNGNALSQAKKPNLDYLLSHYPTTSLHASGIHVGLPWWEEGNSEVGHLTIGAGKVLYQYLPLIINSIQDGSFFKNEALLKVVNAAKQNNSKLHLIGLVSSGAVHSYIDHLYALMELAQQNGVNNTYLHVITDGRDAPPFEGKIFISNLLQRFKQMNFGKIASIIGRTFAMDRNNHWDEVQKAYNLYTKAEGEKIQDPVAYLKKCYANNSNDQIIPPAAIVDETGTMPGQIAPGDAIIFFNFREERMREILMAFADDNFSGFIREKIKNLTIVTMTPYIDALASQVPAAFQRPEAKVSVGQAVSEAGLMQLRIAETEKYAHVTYFFNGLREKPFPGEERYLVPSVGGPEYNKNPEMGASQIANRAVEAVQNENYSFILINFANGDMVGHTGDLNATIRAVEVVDECIGRIIQVALQKDYIILITADHGNCEEKINRVTGEITTEHTSNLVPFYLVGNAYAFITPKNDAVFSLKEAGGFLTDVGPTVLSLLDIPEPTEMTGTSLLPELTNTETI